MFVAIVTQSSLGSEGIPSHESEEAEPLVSKFQKLVELVEPGSTCIEYPKDFNIGNSISATFADFDFRNRQFHCEIKVRKAASQDIRQLVTDGCLSIPLLMDIQKNLAENGNGNNELTILKGYQTSGKTDISEFHLLEICMLIKNGKLHVLKHGKPISEIAKILVKMQTGIAGRLLTEIPDNAGSRRSMIDVIAGMCKLYGGGNYNSHEPQTQLSNAPKSAELDYSCFTPEGHPISITPYRLLYEILLAADDMSPTTEDNAIFTTNYQELQAILDERLAFYQSKEDALFENLSESLKSLGTNFLKQLNQLDSVKLRKLVDFAYQTQNGEFIPSE